MRFLVVAAIIAALASGVGADDPKPLADGLYWVTQGEDGTPLVQANGETTRVGNLYRPDITKASVISISNRNDAYTVRLTCKYDEAAKGRDCVLVIGGVVSRRTGGGWSGEDALYWSFRVDGRKQALAVAKFLGEDVRDRRHPQQQLLVEFNQVGDWLDDGAHEVEVSSEIVGKGTLAFVQGGLSRGARVAQFWRAARGEDPRKGGLPDVGNSLNFGGISATRTLKPGETHRQRVDLRKWFEMKAGTYHLIGTYLMRYVDPATPGDQTPIWVGFATGQGHVTVKSSS